MELTCDELTERLKKEFKEYKRSLVLKSADVVIEHSYETTIKEEIVNYISAKALPKVMQRKILNEDYPLHYLYNKYLKSDSANLFCEIENLFDELKVS
jgi:hypothetical protein